MFTQERKSLLAIGLDYITSIYKYNFNGEKYYNILEYTPTCDTKDVILLDDDIIKHVINYNYNLLPDGKSNKLIVSLSGGVDSMVLITILKRSEFNVVALHINYNNRDESTLEEEFLQNWCSFNNIKLYVKSIQGMKRQDGTLKRSQYEKETRIIRYDFYKEILKKEDADCILLAHHKDDIIENIFANLCRGRTILDLAAMSDYADINDVKIIRPMLKFYKSVIFEFAHKYQIPYFKDTTPKWSVRGKYRNTIFPALKDTFSETIKDNLLNLNKQSNDWNELIQEKIIIPFIKEIRWNPCGCVFNCENYKNYNISFWNEIFQKIFYHYGKCRPSKRGITSFMQNIQTKNVSYISISQHCHCRNKNYEISLKF